MIRGAAVLRPEPGGAETAARLAARGIDVVRLPLFAVRPVHWIPPDPGRHDALLLTSANAVRHGGADLARYRHLPVIAVGKATAAAARAAGFAVTVTGTADAAAALALAGPCRPLHLAGRDRHDAGVEAVAVYASELQPVPPGGGGTLAGRVALVHSVRAAGALTALLERDTIARDRVAVAAISPAVAAAAGEGWCWRLTAARPDDAALVACVAERLTAGSPPRISGS